jgi:predicted dehydrogenase
MQRDAGGSPAPRVGAVGCGHWGQHVVRDLLALGAEVWVADRSAAGRARANRLGVEHTVVSAGALPPCDGYVVATPAPTHREVVESLLASDRPIFVEKPPCTAIDDVRALAAAGGDRVYVMHKWRYHPGVEAIGGLVRNGALGAPRTLATTRTGPETLPPRVDVTWHLAVHDLAIALEVLGTVPIARNAVGSLTDDGRIRRCDARLETVGGVAHRLTVATDDHERDRSVRLECADGSVSLADAYDDHLWIERSGRRSEHPIGTALPLEREVGAFLDHLRGGPPPRSTLGDAVLVCEQVAQLDALVRAGVTPG